MITSDASHAPRKRWLRRASAAAIATAVLGIGGTGLSVPVVSAKHSTSDNTGTTSKGNDAMMLEALDDSTSSSDGSSSSGSSSDNSSNSGTSSSSGLGSANSGSTSQGGSHGS